MAITSAWRVRELLALMADPPFTMFSKENILLQPHPKFLARVSSDFHINQTLHLPVFFPKQHHTTEVAAFHTLDVR